MRDASQNGGQVIASLAANAAKDLANRTHRVALVEDRELSVSQTEGLGLRREHAQAEAVERGDHELLRARLADEARHALLHFLRSLVGEGDGQDRSGQDPAIEEPRDPRGDDARLARAGARENEEGTGIVLDGFPLRGVERMHRLANYAGGEDASSLFF